MPLSLQARQVQKQAQVLTPAMWMDLRLLSLPLDELKTEIKKQAETNPAIVLHDRLPQASSEKRDFLFENARARGESLDEHLMSALRLSGVSEAEGKLCEAIIADIDADGRFKGSFPDLQTVTGATAEQLEAARQKVMRLEALGCGARTLAECFRVQAEELQKDPHSGFHPTVAQGKELKKALELMEQTQQSGQNSLPPLSRTVVMLLKKLEPFPGRKFDYRPADYVTPDVHVDKAGNVTLDTRDIPEVVISPKYLQMAHDSELDKEARAYALERVRKAQEFREALVKRQDTMRVIAEEAVGFQREFLRIGDAGMKQLTMSEVAKKAKCDVSTVSRAAARKYVKTPWGTRPFRQFFVLRDQAPLMALKALLLAHPKASDQEISDLTKKDARFGEKGFARRTVAKYRNRFGISHPKVAKKAEI